MTDSHPTTRHDRAFFGFCGSILLLLLLSGVVMYFAAPPPGAARAEAGVFSVFTSQISVLSTVTVVVAARPGRFDVNIEQTTAGADIYCGSPAAGHGAVTLTNGHLLPAGKGSNMTLHTSAEVDCISVGATVPVSYAEDF